MAIASRAPTACRRASAVQATAAATARSLTTAQALGGSMGSLALAVGGAWHPPARAHSHSASASAAGAVRTAGRLFAMPTAQGTVFAPAATAGVTRAGLGRSAVGAAARSTVEAMGSVVRTGPARATQAGRASIAVDPLVARQTPSPACLAPPTAWARAKRSALVARAALARASTRVSQHASMRANELQRATAAESGAAQLWMTPSSRRPRRRRRPWRMKDGREVPGNIRWGCPKCHGADVRYPRAPLQSATKT